MLLQFGADYWQIGGEHGGDDGGDGDVADRHPVLVMYERNNRALFGHRVMHKGADEQAARLVAADLDLMGVRKAAFRTDQEPSIKALIDLVRVIWGGELVPEEAQRGESDDNALAESAVQVHQGLVRTFKADLEGRLGWKIPDMHPIISWMAEWAATQHRRCKVGPDGRTAYENLHGRPPKPLGVCFSERASPNR